MDRRASEAQDFNRMVQGLGDLVSTGGYLNAGYVPRGYTRPQPQAQQYDLGPARDMNQPEYQNWSDYEKQYQRFKKPYGPA